MADGTLAGAGSLKGKVSEEEWTARVELAALYRLAAIHGWDDAIFTHISMRVPGPEHHFLINPYGLFFDEITASSLVKVDLEGAIVQETPYFINPAGFTIHSDAGVGVSAQAEGLLPISQNALLLLPSIAYHEYEGVALNLDERERIVKDLGDKPLMLLRNHGTLSAGPTAAATWLQMFFFERACAQQVAALSGGRDKVLIAPEAAQIEAARQGAIGSVGKLAWPGFLRKLDRHLPGYDA